MAELSYEEVMGQAKTKEFSYEEVMGGVVKPKRTRQQVEVQVNKAQALRPPIETLSSVDKIGSALHDPVAIANTGLPLTKAAGLGKQIAQMGGQNYTIPTPDDYQSFLAANMGKLDPLAFPNGITPDLVANHELISDPQNPNYAIIEPKLREYFNSQVVGQPSTTSLLSTDALRALVSGQAITPQPAAVLQQADPAMAALSGLVGGTENLVLGAGEFLTSPAGAGTMGIGSAGQAVKALAKGGIGGSMMVGGGQEVAHGIEQSKQGDVAGTIESFLKGLALGLGGNKMVDSGFGNAAQAIRDSRTLNAEFVEPTPSAPAPLQLGEGKPHTRFTDITQGVLKNELGQVIQDTRKPIYPRQSGDPAALLPEKSGRTVEQLDNQQSAAQVAQNPPVRDLTIPDPPLSQPYYILPREQRQALPEPKFDISALSKDEQDVVLSTIRDFRTRKAQEPGKVIGEEPSYLPPTKEQMEVKASEPSAGESGLVIKQDQIKQTPVKSDFERYQEVDKRQRELMKEGDLDSPEMMELGKEREAIKNRHGGMPPKQGGIGGGINKAIEGNKESGSILNPFKSKPPTKPAIGDLQRLDDYETMKKRATTAYGIGGYESLNFPKTTKKVKEVLGQEETHYQLGLGRFFDPRSGEKSPIEEALLTHSLTKETGKSLTTVRRASWDNLPDPFPVDKETGTITLADGSKGYMSDVVEAEMRNPGSQKLTKVQRDAVELAKRYNEEIKQMAEEEGVKLVEVSDGEKIDLSKPYLTRPAVGKVKNGKLKEAKDSLKSRMSIGSERYYQKRRQHQSEAEGVEDGIKYMPNFYDRLAEHQKNVYRAIADQRLANDPALKGDAKYKFMENGLTYNPAFHGRYFSKEGIKAIQDANEAPLSGWTKGLNNVNNLLKAMKFTGDMSTPWNQGLSMMYSNPIRWSKATWAGFKALGNDKVLANYLALPENLRAAQRIAAKGGSIGRLEDFLAGTEKGQLAEKIGVIRASNRSMSTFLSVAKVELYKAFEPLMKKKGWNEAEMVEAIGNTLGSAKMESIGIGTRRALIERLVFNAPTFQRAAANLVAMAGKGGASGAVSRKALGSLAVGIGATMYALYSAQVEDGTMTQAEMDERLDFRSSKFMRVGWNLGSGEEPTENKLEDAAKEQRLEVSYGNIFLTVTRLLGDLTEIAQGDKEFGTGTKNPFIGFVANRKSPIADLIEKAVTGKDRMGNEQELYKAALQAFAPMPLENFSQKGGTKKNDLGIPIPTRQGMASFGLGLGGGASFPESFSSKRNRLADKVSQDLYKAPDRTKLGLADRLFTDKMVDDALEIVKSRPSISQRLQSETTDLKRGQKVFNLLSPEVKDAMEKAGVEMPAIQSHKVIKKKESNKVGLPLHLTQEEQKMLTQKLGTVLDSLMKEHFVSFQGSPKARKDQFGEVMKVAKDQAWAEVIGAIMEMDELVPLQPEPSQLLVP